MEEVVQVNFLYLPIDNDDICLAVSFPDSSMSAFRILLELRMMEMVVTTAAVRREKLQSNRHHQRSKTQLFTGRMPFLSPNQQCKSTEGHTIIY